MPDTHSARFDIVVLGSGFAGTLMALILQRQGYRVGILEKGSHPRFAIGESSTPIADIILRQLSARYQLPWLEPFSRYGSWQNTHPEIVCGLKRGFSFFKHHPHRLFETNAGHQHQLFVAASASNELSDTHWLRADFDFFLLQQAIQNGISYVDRANLLQMERKAEHWQLDGHADGEPLHWQADFLIDATGSGLMAEKFLGIASGSEGFQTNSTAIYSHFLDLPLWTDALNKWGISQQHYPFSPDDSALHQVLDEGWLWSLRFNDGRTSVGLVLEAGKSAALPADPAAAWQQVLQRYPAMAHAFLGNARLAPVPGRLIGSGRLQRRLQRAVANGWLALPNTAGFVDPLFSTGIAHSLAGIEKLGELFSERPFSNPFEQGLRDYETAVFNELAWIDELIAGCYVTLPYFEGFTAWSMLFFTATVAYEQLRLGNMSAGQFLKADDSHLREMVREARIMLAEAIRQANQGRADWAAFSDWVRKIIAPWNTARLLDPDCGNMYPHTAAEW